MRTWQRELEMTVSQCHALVSAQFPDFAGKTPEMLGSGWDNLCIRYPDDVVFRLPTRTMGGTIIEHEIAAMPHLHGRLPLEIPEFRYVGLPTESYPWSFVGYRLIKGSLADEVDWTSDTRRLAIEPLAKFLRALHSLDLPNLDLPQEPLDEKMVQTFRDRLHLRQKFVVENYPEQKDWADELVELGMSLLEKVQPEDNLSFIHGDLYPHHIVVDDQLRIKGVIDWGDVKFGNPAVDLSIAYSFFDAAERDEFWHAYGLNVSDSAKRYAHVKAAIYALALYGFGRNVENPLMVRLGEEIARRVLSD